jgi:hypothetical protein
MANLNIAERRVPQDGRIMKIVGGKPVDMRVSTLPTVHGESVVLRVLDRASVNLDLENLNLPPAIYDYIIETVNKPNGIFIVTGPTGAGKTTTLYAALRKVNTIDSKLLTVEDPVEYDIEVRVPRGASVEVSTVNDGDVTVEGVNGSFDLKNVNGAVRLVDAGGSGSINTVNGDVEATFARAPGEPSSFRTVNGELDVTFPANLSADLAFRTMQGDVYTDFDVAAVDGPAEVRRDRNRYAMNLNRPSAFRIGTGGQTHSFNTLNGDILVRKAN